CDSNPHIPNASSSNFNRGKITNLLINSVKLPPPKAFTNKGFRFVHFCLIILIFSFCTLKYWVNLKNKKPPFMLCPIHPSSHSAQKSRFRHSSFRAVLWMRHENGQKTPFQTPKGAYNQWNIKRQSVT